VAATEASVILDFSIQVTSNVLASLVVVTEDEYTFFVDGNPKLSGATVRLQNLVTFDS